MGHGKETPRQKMIGLMYLFLTAMLALNVSKEVLNSFILVGNGLEQTIANYVTKNEKVYNEFETQSLANPTKVKPWKDKADLIKAEAADLFDYLNQQKIDLAKYAEGDETKAVVDGKFVIAKLEQKDNIDKGGEFFGELGKKHGDVIKEKLDHLKETLMTMIPEEEENLRKNIETTLSTHSHTDDEGVTHSWVSSTFEHIPLIADFVMLDKLQTDVKNVETDVITYLFKKISASDFKVNKMSAIVIPNSNYVVQGVEYKADVFLAAYDSTQSPEIFIGKYKKIGDSKYEIVGSSKTLDVENGKGIYKTGSNSVGDFSWGGFIRIKSPDGGGSQDYPFDVKYQVAKPNLVISPTKMNVFYYGIDNPVDISVPGFPADKIKPIIADGASIRKESAGSYMVKPTKTGGTVTVQVMAEIDGKSKSMGSLLFRIKTIPEPKAKVMGQSSGVISKALLANAPGVVAELEDFVFDLKFRVTNFTLTTTVGGYTKEINVKGNQFNREQLDLIKGIKTGSKITIEDIVAVGPDERPKPLSPIIFKVK